ETACALPGAGVSEQATVPGVTSEIDLSTLGLTEDTGELKSFVEDTGPQVLKPVEAPTMGPAVQQEPPPTASTVTADQPPPSMGPTAKPATAPKPAKRPAAKGRDRSTAAPKKAAKDTATPPDPPPSAKSAKATTAPKPKVMADDPQRGVKAAVERVTQKLANEFDDIVKGNKAVNKAALKVADLRKQVDATPRADPGRPKLVKKFNAAQKKLEELQGQQEHRNAIKVQDEAQQKGLQAALDAKTY